MVFIEESDLVGEADVVTPVRGHIPPLSLTQSP
jgi:hypothetical protein